MCVFLEMYIHFLYYYSHLLGSDEVLPDDKQWNEIYKDGKDIFYGQQRHGLLTKFGTERSVDGDIVSDYILLNILQYGIVFVIHFTLALRVRKNTNEQYITSFNSTNIYDTR
mgnify:CR=1 FL=1